jgi:hypothetical protein
MSPSPPSRLNSISSGRSHHLGSRASFAPPAVARCF